MTTCEPVGGRRVSGGVVHETTSSELAALELAGWLSAT